MIYPTNMIEEAMRKFWKRNNNLNNSPNFNIKPIGEEKDHKWDKWQITKEFEIGPNWPLGLYLLQKRSCQGCGFTQINFQKILI